MMMRQAFIPLLQALSWVAEASSPGKAGYGLFVPEWEVRATPNGPLINLNGTVQQVHSQLLDINPRFSVDFDIEPSRQDQNQLQRRTSQVPIDGEGYKGFDAIKCAPHDDLVPLNRVDDGVYYLQKVAGRPVNGPGPNTCGRVSCSYTAAIYWCNDYHEFKKIESFNAIAIGAHYAAHMCTYELEDTAEVWFTAAQAIHQDGWRVVVRYDPSDGCDVL